MFEIKSIFGRALASATQTWSLVWFDQRFKIGRYALVGSAVSIGYTINVVAFVEILHWPSPEWASALSFVIWTPISYLAHRDFTFIVHRPGLASLLKFVAAFVARFAASAYSVHLVATLGLHYIVGVMANWIVLPLISYLILDLWVFRASSPPIAPDRGATQFPAPTT
jgi:putative flippase GtrA